MKKVISLFLCAIMIFSMGLITAAAKTDSVVITVANDLHLDLEDSFADSVRKRNSVSAEYAHVSAGGQLLYESYAILKAFLENAAKNESGYVIIPGDISNNGLVAEQGTPEEIFGAPKTERLQTFLSKVL